MLKIVVSIIFMKLFNFRLAVIDSKDTMFWRNFFYAKIFKH